MKGFNIMKKRINFSETKSKAMGKLRGNWFMFGVWLLISTIVFTILLPTKYVYSFVEYVGELSVLEYLRIFIATAVAESLIFTFISAMYRIIFKKESEEKGKVKLLFQNANLVFPSAIIPILLTKVSFAFFNFLTTPTVSNFLYDYLFFSSLNYVVHSWIILITGAIVSILSIYVAFAYILTPCIIADNPEISGLMAMKLSRLLMKKRKWNMFFFILSFAPWYLIGLFGFGIGMLWAHAYAMTGVYAYYEELKAA